MKEEIVYSINFSIGDINDCIKDDGEIKKERRTTRVEIVILVMEHSCDYYMTKIKGK